MTVPLTTREALANALHDAGDPCLGGCQRMADALLASGAIIDAGALAEDESLVEAVHERYFDVDMETCRWWGQRRDVVRGFRALAAALSAR